MIQVKNQTLNDLIDHKNFKKCHLSIQLSLSGLAFCIFDKELIDVVLLKEYSFDNRPQTPRQLLTHVEEVFKEDAELTEKFESVHITHKNNLATIVPDSLYDKEYVQDYLKYTVKVLNNDFINVDNIEENEAKNIYIPFQNINSFFKTKYPKFTYEHASSILISNLLKYQSHSLNQYFFVNVSNNCLDIIYLSDDKLHLYNSFLFHSKEDFLYYILFAMEQLGLSPNEQQLTFLGDINKNSQLYTLTYTYVRNIDFLNVDNHILSEEFYEMNPHIEKHQYFELLNQF